MPSYSGNSGTRTPFGKNAYLRSTKDVKTESYTFYKAAIPTEDIDGDDLKVLQPGTVIAKITSGAGSGKVGVFDSGATDGRQTTSNIVGVVDTFLPWELEERDADVAVTYEATCVQAWCFEYDDGERVALTNTTRDAIIALAGNDLNFR